MAGTLWAADNPFVGNWKVKPSKSMLNDEMKVEVAGANRYAITFGPGQVDTVSSVKPSGNFLHIRYRCVDHGPVRLDAAGRVITVFPQSGTLQVIPGG